MTLKAFEYDYSIPYGYGCGIVFAETKEDAIKMIKEKPYSVTEDLDLEIKEIDTSKPCVIDHSWCE